MALDCTYGCVNFRDFGGYINLIAGKQLLPENRFYRGGSVDYVKEHIEIKKVQSIVNLRNRADYHEFDCDYYHFPMSNKVEKYDTTNNEVKIWLNKIIKIFENENFKFPFLIHCLSGKDRTGIIVSALLLILDIDIAIIKEEYLLSIGEVKLSLIEQSIDGMKDIHVYFDKIDIEKVKQNLLK